MLTQTEENMLKMFMKILQRDLIILEHINGNG